MLGAGERPDTERCKGRKVPKRARRKPDSEQLSLNPLNFDEIGKCPVEELLLVIKDQVIPQPEPLMTVKILLLLKSHPIENQMRMAAINDLIGIFPFPSDQQREHPVYAFLEEITEEDFCWLVQMGREVFERKLQKFSNFYECYNSKSICGSLNLIHLLRKIPIKLT